MILQIMLWLITVINVAPGVKQLMQVATVRHPNPTAPETGGPVES